MGGGALVSGSLTGWSSSNSNESVKKEHDRLLNGQGRFGEAVRVFNAMLLAGAELSFTAILLSLLLVMVKRK